jgi:membrane protein YqaA with SNARE-associated domain
MVIEIFNALVGTYGYLGVFLVSMLGSATIFLPLPSTFVVFFSAAFLNPLLLGLVGGLGAAIGELTGYVLGFGGKKLIERKWKKKLVETEKLFQKHGGFLIILIFAATPLPDDIVGLLGGSLGYPVKRFFLATLIGKIILHLILAYGGYYSLNWVLEVFASFS